jgi:hypothetical protein
MAPEVPALVFELDPGQYIAAYHRFDDEGHQWSQWELDLVNGVAFWLGKDEVEGLPHVVAAGFLFALFEVWQPFDELRFETLGRASLEAEIAETFGPGWGDEWPSVIYGVLHCESKIDELAADPGLVDERLPHAFEAIVAPLFEGGMRDENRDAWFGFFRFGVAAGLYFAWERRMDQRGVPTEERFRDWVFVEPANDRLAGLDLPAVVRGCELRRHPLTGYELVSTGPLGGGHMTSFRSDGDLAVIFAVGKEGKLGNRRLKVPTERHVDALRELGFKEVRFPNGKLYELRTWPGLRRIE